SESNTHPAGYGTTRPVCTHARTGRTPPPAHNCTTAESQHPARPLSAHTPRSPADFEHTHHKRPSRELLRSGQKQILPETPAAPPTGRQWSAAPARAVYI